MSVTTVDLMGHLAHVTTVPFIDNLKAGPAAAVATATIVTTMASRFTSSPGNTGSAVMKDILTLDAPNVCWVINDSGFTLNLYPSAAPGTAQTINGATTPITIANGGFAFLSRVRANGDWRAAVFT